MAHVNPSESDGETRRKLGLNKGQKAVDRLNAGFDAALTASKSPKRPYETPRARQRRELAERRNRDAE